MTWRGPLSYPGGGQCSTLARASKPQSSHAEAQEARAKMPMGAMGMVEDGLKMDT